MAPALRLACSADCNGARLGLLLGRFSYQSGDAARVLFEREFRPVVGRFAAVVARALPGLDAEALAWRLHFAIGAMAHTLQNAPTLARLSDGRCDPDDVDQMIEELVAFAAGGLGATAPKTTKAPT